MLEKKLDKLMEKAREEERKLQEKLKVDYQAIEKLEKLSQRLERLPAENQIKIDKILTDYALDEKSGWGSVQWVLTLLAQSSHASELRNFIERKIAVARNDIANLFSPVRDQYARINHIRREIKQLRNLQSIRDRIGNEVARSAQDRLRYQQQEYEIIRLSALLGLKQEAIELVTKERPPWFDGVDYSKGV